MLCWSYICLYCTATYSFIIMFPMILHHRLNFLLFRELVTTMLPSFVRICVGSLTWNACLHVFSLAGNLVYYIWYINRYMMQQTGLSRLLVAANCFCVYLQNTLLLFYFGIFQIFRLFLTWMAHAKLPLQCRKQKKFINCSLWRCIKETASTVYCCSSWLPADVPCMFFD